jgi:hypothetical protein
VCIYIYIYKLNEQCRSSVSSICTGSQFQPACARMHTKCDDDDDDDDNNNNNI